MEKGRISIYEYMTFTISLVIITILLFLSMDADKAAVWIFVIYVVMLALLILQQIERFTLFMHYIGMKTLIKLRGEKMACKEGNKIKMLMSLNEPYAENLVKGQILTVQESMGEGTFHIKNDRGFSYKVSRFTFKVMTSKTRDLMKELLE